MLGQLLDRKQSGGERGRWDRGKVCEPGLELGTHEDISADLISSFSNGKPSSFYFDRGKQKYALPVSERSAAKHELHALHSETGSA